SVARGKGARTVGGASSSSVLMEGTVYSFARDGKAPGGRSTIGAPPAPPARALVLGLEISVRGGPPCTRRQAPFPSGRRRFMTAPMNHVVFASAGWCYLAALGLTAAAVACRGAEPTSTAAPSVESAPSVHDGSSVGSPGSAGSAAKPPAPSAEP